MPRPRNAGGRSACGAATLQQGAFIAALAAKPETLDEIAGTFDALYEYDTTRVSIDTPEPTIDNAGTGGDTLKTFNISTGAAIVAAACGLYVSRHCSRAEHFQLRCSRCGRSARHRCRVRSRNFQGRHRASRHLRVEWLRQWLRPTFIGACGPEISLAIQSTSSARCSRRRCRNTG